LRRHRNSFNRPRRRNRDRGAIAAPHLSRRCPYRRGGARGPGETHGARAGVRRASRARSDPKSEPTFLPGELCADWEGFSLHAKVRVEADDRVRLERLCRYIARPPIATERLSLTPDGRVAYGLRHKWRDGTTHMVFDPLTFLERLAALVPRPKKQLLTYHGVLAPAAAWRDDIVPRVETRDAPDHPSRRRRPIPAPTRRSWAELMLRTFGIDVLRCPHCGAKRRLIALIERPSIVRAILRHLGLDHEPVQLKPARPPPQLELAFEL
jgi:hypothetical protein